MRLRVPHPGRRGLTLVELVLASALFSLLLVAVFQLIEGSLSLWRRGEARRNVLEQTTSVAELLARDLRTLEGGSSGDLVMEWVAYDSDKDGATDCFWPRLRMVRQVSAPERSLIYELTAVQRAEALSREGVQVTAADVALPEIPEGHGLAEVLWLIRPLGTKDADDQAEALVMRAERLVEDTTQPSFFADDFFSPTGVPRALPDVVSGGLLWMGVQAAAQTSVVKDGWDEGPDLRHVATSWDAWRARRPDVEVHDWNREHPGLPIVEDDPTFPRRVRIEFEFERAKDRRFRPRLESAMTLQDSTFEVDVPEHLPRGEDAHVKIDGEWMRVLGISGFEVRVARAQRGTAPAQHTPGALVHHGVRMVREVPIAVYSEDWNL